MVIDIFPYIIQIIVFPTSTNALLRVNNSLQFGKVTARINSALKYGLELRNEYIR